MSLEEKYAVALGILSIFLLVVGTVIGLYFRTAPAKIVRQVFPFAAVLTLGSFAVFVAIARAHVKG